MYGIASDITVDDYNDIEHIGLCYFKTTDPNKVYTIHFRMYAKLPNSEDYYVVNEGVQQYAVIAKPVIGGIDCYTSDESVSGYIDEFYDGKKDADYKWSIQLDKNAPLPVMGNNIAELSVNKTYTRSQALNADNLKIYVYPQYTASAEANNDGWHPQYLKTYISNGQSQKGIILCSQSYDSAACRSFTNTRLTDNKDKTDKGYVPFIDPYPISWGSANTNLLDIQKSLFNNVRDTQYSQKASTLVSKGILQTSLRFATSHEPDTQPYSTTEDDLIQKGHSILYKGDFSGAAGTNMTYKVQQDIIEPFSFKNEAQGWRKEEALHLSFNTFGLSSNWRIGWGQSKNKNAEYSDRCSNF